MPKRKGFLQKFSLVMSMVSFVLAITSAVILYFKVESLGSQHPISASLMASTFFFICVGAILAIMGNADLPSFKIDVSEETRILINNGLTKKVSTY